MKMYDDFDISERPRNRLFGRPDDDTAQPVTYIPLRPSRALTLTDVDDPSISRIDVHRLIAMTRLQRFMLLRLERTLKMQRLWLETGGNFTAAEPWKSKLIAKTVFSALRDCIDADIIPEAQDLLRSWLR